MSSSSTPHHTTQAQWKQINFSDVRVMGQIGGGGVGMIYEGVYEGKRCAVKMLFDPTVNDHTVQEYMDELMVMSQLDHPNIVHLYGACMTPPNMCFVLELCDTSLFEMIHDQKAPFTTYERVQILLDVATALQYLHSQRPCIIHRDIKTKNLLVRKGVVKVCDFGLVRTKVTQAGTPAYMAPELLNGSAFNRSVDVYAFGVVVWELFTGQIPYDGLDIPEIREAVCSGERQRVPVVDTPKEIRELIETCWHQDPAARPTFDDIVPGLQRLLETTPAYGAPGDLDVGDFGDDALDSLMAGK